MKNARLSLHSDKKQTLVDNALKQIHSFEALIKVLADTLPNRRNYDSAEEYNVDRRVALDRIKLLRASQGIIRDDFKTFLAR